MNSVKEYIKSVAFSFNYAFRFAKGLTLILMVFYVVSGVLSYLSSYLLGALVNTIVLGTKNGVYGNIWYLLLIYTFVNALPTILGNIQMYLNRRRVLILQMVMDI